METIKRSWHKVPRVVRQAVIGIVGIVVIIIGIILVPLPGPGWGIIFVGLAILSSEFIWAERLRTWTIQKFKSAFEALKQRKAPKNRH